MQAQGAPTPAGLNFAHAWDVVQGRAFVGLADNGIQLSHPDLQANTRFHFARNYVNELYERNVDEIQTATLTFAGHGTHVAGIIAATPNVNPTSVAGGCWSCSLTPIRVDPEKPSTLGRGLDYLIKSGYQVVNLSLGTPSGLAPNCASPSFVWSVYCTALQLAQDRDVALVAASGNKSASTIDFPASHAAAIAVGGIGPSGSFWTSGYHASNPGSNSGSQQAVVAPARDVLSTFYEGRTWNSDIRCADRLDSSISSSNSTFVQGYGNCNGTSMAAPHVSALLGLVRTANPLLSTDATRMILTSTASRSVTGLGHDTQMGYGIPDARRAVQLALGHILARNRLTPMFSLYSSEGANHFCLS
jgi:subtilisin family serine protease